MASDKTTTRRLLDEGQSPWIDTITRAMLLDGAFQRLLDRDIVDMTRDSSAFQTATGGSDADELGRLVRTGESVATICHALVLDDSHAAGALLHLISYDAGTGTEAAVQANGREQESMPWT